MVHGFGASTYTWRKTLESLAPCYRVFAFDLKGFGLSAKPRDGLYNMEAYTAHLLGFLDAMKLERTVLVGHSLGGALVTRFALLHPERVEAVVLVSPVPVSMPRDDRVLKRVGGNEAQTAAEKAASLNPKLASRLLPTLLRSTITRETVEAGLKVAYHDTRHVTPEMIDTYYRPITIEGAPEALASMAVPPPPPSAPLPPLDSMKLPALVAWGQHDGVVPHESFEHYVRSISGSKKVVFLNSGHVPHEEEADEFQSRLREFLDQLP
ncbi:MAG: alpha/beta fold hydrolase [Isosphaeraceae bacterium]